TAPSSLAPCRKPLPTCMVPTAAVSDRAQVNLALYSVAVEATIASVEQAPAVPSATFVMPKDVAVATAMVGATRIVWGNAIRHAATVLAVYSVQVIGQLPVITLRLDKFLAIGAILERGGGRALLQLRAGEAEAIGRPRRAARGRRPAQRHRRLGRRRRDLERRGVARPGRGDGE